MPRDLFSQPLFSPKLLRKAFPAQSLTPEQHSLISDWAHGLKGALGQQKEEAIRPVFLQKFFCELLGYVQMGSAGSWTLEHEGRAAQGSADAVLGVFTERDRTTVAPFELKGPKTSNLDALMSGRHKSPVQQAWEYAVDLPGSQFILVSNCDEVRLYAMGYGRAAFESWQIADLQDPQQLANFIGLLHADRFITGQTQALLSANASQEREITQALYADYKSLRQDLIVGLHHLNPALAFVDVVRLAQKLIDRLLFIAFAQSRDLLPQGSIEQAAKHIDPYNPQPRWVNFRALFAAVDIGNPFLKIPPYNGGLFAPDALLDALTVSDKLVQSFTRLSGYDYEQEVSVTVLGRIFEQSISDLEIIAQAGDIEAFKLENASPVGKAPSSKSVDGKRKRDGVVYTPDHITRFIVEQTLSPVIIERFEKVRANYSGSQGEAWRKPSKDEKLHAPPTVAPDQITEYAFWLAWQQEITRIRVCDPACGSGAFLVAAFDLFKEAYTQLHLKLRELAPQELLQYDISHSILSNNLFGVDINAESIEITKLSLWLKTAEKGRPLAGLEANFYHGNSLVSDAQLDPLAFDWAAKFSAFCSPDAINTIAHHADSMPARGSKSLKDHASIAAFDVILGNPPYVRQELFTAFKPYLESRYTAYHGVADLYVYFYELGLDLLKDGGRLGFISSSSFFKTSSGEPLRRLLRQYGRIESLVDFGDWQVFEGVTTYPAIVVMKKNAPEEGSAARFVQLSQAVPDLSVHFKEHAQTLPLSQLSGGAGTAAGVALEWQLEGQEAAQLRAKLLGGGHPSLKEALGSPYRGVLTGLNEAFVIDRATRDRLIDADPSCAALLKPFLKGDDIERWRVESQDLWLILLPKGWTQAQLNLKPNRPLAVIESAQNATESVAFQWLQSQHPSLAAHLAPFADAARKRTDQGDYWWELRACAYYEKFEKAKIFYPDICVAPCFYLDSQGYFAGNTGYFLPSDQAWAAALLNSKAQWFLIAGMSTHIRGGYRRMFTQQIETLPIPQASAHVQSQLAQLAQSAQEAAAERLTLQRQFQQRILDLRGQPAVKGAQTTLSEKLKTWWQLSDFTAFQAEVSKRFKCDIPLRDRAEWQAFFEDEKEKARTLTHSIQTLEKSIDQMVYDLFQLNPAEIALIERSTLR